MERRVGEIRVSCSDGTTCAMCVPHSPVRVRNCDSREVESGAMDKEDKHWKNDQQGDDPVNQSNLATLGFCEVNDESSRYHSSTTSGYGCSKGGTKYML